MANGGTAISLEAPQLSSCRTRDDGIGLLRLAALEHPNALEYKAAGLVTDSSDDPLEANERSRGRRSGTSLGTRPVLPPRYRR